MNYEDFKEKLMEEVKEVMYERDIAAEISTTIVEKMNQTYDAMTVTPEGSNIGMNLNMQVYYDAYDSGLEFEEIVEKLVDSVEEHLPTMPMVDTEQLTNYEKMKERIAMEVVYYDRNKDLLLKVLYPILMSLLLAERILPLYSSC